MSCRRSILPGSGDALIQALEPRRLLAASPYHWPLGRETLVNSNTLDLQIAPAVAMDADGDYVVAWASYHDGGYFTEIYAQRYSAGGMPQGGEFHVNTGTDGSLLPAAAMDADGDFVITWISYDGDGSGIFAQRFDAAGTPQGTEFRVNTFTTSLQLSSSVAMDADGDFVVAWHSYAQEGDDTGVYVQRYNAAGVAQGGEFRVNTFTPSHQRVAAVAMDADSNFVVAWESYGQDGDGWGIYAQRYHASGIPQGTEFRVNSYTTGHQQTPSVDMDDDGDFVVAWHSFGQDGSGWGIYAQRYDAAGVPQGSEFAVNSFTFDDQQYGSVAMDADGDFIIAWDSHTQDGSGYGVYARRYTAAGAAQGPEFRVNTATTGDQFDPAVAMDATGDFVITWRGYSQHANSYEDIHAQRYTAFSPTQAASVGDRVWDDANSNGIQDPSEQGIAGATVEIYNGEGSWAAVSETNATGQYSFLVPAGASAQLRFLTPDGLIPTRKDQGADDMLDSDADRITGLTAIFIAPAAGADNLTLDAGFLLPASVSGSVFFDRNGDGIPNGGEEALAGFEVFADFDGNGAHDPDEPVVSTGPAGTYTFTSALGGTYRLIVVDQEAWTEPAMAPITVPTGGVVSQIHLPVRTTVPDSAAVAQGGEFRVNANTKGRRGASAVAMDADGDFVVAWHTGGLGYAPGDIYAQRYSAAGVPQGPESRVNTFTTGFQLFPSVAMDADGDFVIAWQSEYQDGVVFGVYAQRFSAAGVPQGPEFRVNTFTHSQQQRPSVAMDADGDFVIAWESYDQDVFRAWGVYAQRYNAAGVAQGPEFRVSPLVAAFTWHRAPSVAMDAGGNFVISWFGEPQRGIAYDVYAQRYNAAGVKQGPDLRVNTHTIHAQYDPAVAMDDDGDFVITWTSYGQDSPNTDGIYAQRFNASGDRQGTEFRVNSYTPDLQQWSAIAMDADGDFVVTWASYGQDGSKDGVYAQRYNSAGVPQGAEFRVNSSTSDFQTGTAVAMDAQGSFVVTWSQFVTIEDPPANIYAQRYDVSVRPAVVASQFVWQTAPQRIKFTFDQDVSASLSLADITVQDLTHSMNVTPNSLSYNAATNTATVTFSGILADAEYRATVAAGGVSNAAGTTLAADYALDFFFLQADANHDRRVNLADFNILASNFGRTDATFGHGDFNYDGRVNLQDFNLLAGGFGTALGATASGDAGLSRTRARDLIDQLLA